MNKRHTMNIRKTVTAATIGLAICTLASSAKAVGIQGAYNYTLVLRDQMGFAIGSEGGKVSAYYTFEVYNAAGETIYTQASSADRTISSSVGCNYLLSVCTYSDVNNPMTHYAVPGEQLTLVVKSGNKEVFRSSKILPPIQYSGANSAPIGVFYADPTDTDGLYDQWLEAVNYYCDAYNGDTIGGKEDDYDSDGFSNLREYQFGTDPTGDLLELVDKPGVSITEEEDDVIKVSFNYVFDHVYSVRAIGGSQTYGVDGQDLALYDSRADLDAGSSSGKYFCDRDWNTGTKTYYVKKPNINGQFVIGLAVDGRLLEYLTMGVNTFEITWKDDAGETIDTTNVNDGDTPAHDAPTKSAEAPYAYVFTGWTPAIEAASSNATYTATFAKVVDLTLVTDDWTAADGDVITNSTAHAVTVPAGARVTVNGVTICGAVGGANVPAPEFSDGGSSATTAFAKGEDGAWTLTAFAEIANDAIGSDVADGQIKVYAADTLDGLKSAEPLASGVTVTEKKSAVKTTIEVVPPEEAAQQFFKVEFGE